MSGLEAWAGFECTLNRTGDAYQDQLDLSGHRRRPEDLHLLAELGVKAVRYPVLWERAPDWEWADERLGLLRELGIEPIVGLVHHGSGPPGTSLLDDGFAAGLAEHAAAVAERYPWVCRWTPVNEPLTTARFSALYGHWYPHARDDLAFARALLVQCRATVLAMAAIRGAIPGAELVQTEDIGKVHATPAVAAQAAFENERRWLSLDLLAGTLAADSPVRRWLLDVGVAESELAWFEANPCPPDIIGVNHYLSGERLLDERVDEYPAEVRGGNGRDRYADVLAPPDLREGPAAILRAAWERYGLPLAVTEAHNGCTREEQVRWLVEVWDAASRVRAEGADVRAVTAWSLLGTHGWDRLCTAPGGRYETGLYDLAGGRPRPTAVAAVFSELAAGRSPDHPVLADGGWWRARRRPFEGRPVVVTGANGTLGRAVAAHCDARNLSFRALTRQELDIADPASVRDVVEGLDPWAIVNAAGYVRVDEAESEPDACLRENVGGPVRLAEACAAAGIALVTYSSDLVFDGGASEPYVESDEPAPLNVYGLSKARAERAVLDVCPRALVVRTSAFFGPADRYNFVHHALAELRRTGSFEADAETVVSPTYVPDLVDATLDLLVDGEQGIWHLANEGAVTWCELARSAARATGLDPQRVAAAPAPALPARRPRFSPLGTERGQLLAPLESAVERYAAAVAA